MPASWKCPEGHENDGSGRFCAYCGAARPAVDAARAAYCPSCGAQRTAGRSFCAACGEGFDDDAGAGSVEEAGAAAPAAPVVEQTLRRQVARDEQAGGQEGARDQLASSSGSSSEQGADPSTPRAPQRRSAPPVPLLVGGIGILVVVIVLAAFMLGHSQADNAASKKASAADVASARTTLASAQGSLAGAHNDLAEAVDAASARDGSLAKVRSAGQALSRAAGETLAATSAPGIPSAAGERASQLAAAARADRKLGSAAASLPAAMTTPMGGRIDTFSDAAAESRLAWRELPNSVARAITAKHLAAVVRDFTEQRGKLREWVIELEGILEQSSSGRGDLRAIFDDVAACRMTPEDAASQFESIMSNRGAVLGQLDGVTAPEQRSKRAMTSLRRALQASFEADRSYRRWVLNQEEWYYTGVVGCAGGDMPKDDAWDDGNASSVQASNAKKQFVKLFNPIARQFGKRTWVATDI